MRKEELETRIEELLKTNADGSPVMCGHEVISGTLSLLALVYGETATQTKDFEAALADIRSKWGQGQVAKYGYKDARARLSMLKAEFSSGLTGKIESVAYGSILGDFLSLARAALANPSDGSKNVASVLAAALYEDTIRRLASLSSLPHEEKLETVIGQLKDAKVIQGATVSVANSYLSFRNRALHADFSNVDRPEVQSVLSFTEELLLKHFS